MYLLNILLILFPIVTILGADWGYEKHNGPNNWGGLCKNGKKQSPVDIVTKDLQKSCFTKLWVINYNMRGNVVVENNGHGVEVSGFEKWNPLNRPFMARGGLPDQYGLTQFHFHWSTSLNGSEHTVNGKHYDAEVHFVHVKKGYTFEQAKKIPAGIAVLAVFLKLGNGNAMANLETTLLQVAKKGAKVNIQNFQIGFKFSQQLPQLVSDFYRYEGSLTTPECNENVIWTILPDTYQFTLRQLNLLRAIQGPIPGKPLGSNVRPTQLLNGRKVIVHSCK
uniref:Carbonic anhydrase n=2 Tax=Meloidogyne TaxID=189290 RepID=A0A914LCP4_MELIC